MALKFLDSLYVQAIINRDKQCSDYTNTKIVLKS